MKRKIWLMILSVMVAASMIVAAGCTESDREYSVTISNSEHGTVTATAMTVADGADLEFTIIPDRGYELDALQINGEAVTVSGNKYTVEDVSLDITVTATFKPVSMTVTFSGADAEPKQVTYNGTYGTLPDAIPPVGYRFKGWYTEENGGGSKIEADTLVSEIANHTLYAYFSDKYTVTFDYGDGSGTETSREVAYNAAIGELPAVTAPGSSVFVGFYAGTEKLDATYPITGDITIKASYVTASIELAEDSPVSAIGGLEDVADVCPSFSITVQRDGSAVAADAYTVESSDSAVAEYSNGKLIAKTDGKVAVVVKFNGIEVARSEEISCVSYADYVKVSTPQGFLDIAKDKAGKYYLADDIDLKGQSLYNPAESASNGCWFGTFSGVIDGFGHKVYNMTLPTGWNNGAFKVLTGTVKNIAFTEVKTETSKVAGEGFFGNVKDGGLVENVFLDIEFKHVGQNTDHGWAAFASYVDAGGTLRNCVANIRSAVDLTYAAGIAHSANSWEGKVENCFAMVNGKSVGADVYNGVYYKEAANGVAAAITENSGVYPYTYSLLNSTETDVSLLDSAVWSVKDGALYFNNEVALAATPEYLLQYTGGDIEKIYEENLPAKEILSINVLHNTVKMDTIPENFLQFSSTNESVAVVGFDADQHVVYIDYKGEGATNIAISIAGDKDVSVTFSVVVKQLIQIATAAEFREKVPNNLAGNFILTDNIDFNNQTPLGEGWNSFGTFSGTLDGNGHKIGNVVLGNGWNGGIFSKVTGTIKNIAFTNIQSPPDSANTANGLFGSLDGGAVIENVYIDYVMRTNGGAIGTDVNYVAAGPLTGLTVACNVTNVIINLRFAENFDFNAIDRIGSIAGKANAWASVLSNVRVIVNAPDTVSLKLAWADAVENDGVQSSWKNCANYTSLAALAASDLTSFTAWTITDSSISLGDSVVLQQTTAE